MPADETPHPDLSFATMEEIADELQKRTSGFLLVVAFDHKTDKDLVAYDYFFKDRMTALGLSEVARVKLLAPFQTPIIIQESPGDDDA